MKKLSLIPLCLTLVTIVACGDDTAPPADSGTDTMMMSNNCPFPDEQMGACCARSSNAANLDSPQLRVSGVRLSTPASLSTIIVTALLTTSLDDDLFNWLIEADVTGTEAVITTGYGLKNPDNTFSFTMGTAPMPGSPDRWDPVMVVGSIDGDTVSAPVLNETFTVPVLNEDGSEVTLELPLRNMTLEMADLTEDRSCIGMRVGRNWVTSSGNLNAFITVADADAGVLNVPDAGINTTLCLFTANISMPPAGSSCADFPQDTWPVMPDALCDTDGCTADPGDGSVCDPGTTCNAWYLEAGFAAQGVTITP